MKNETGKWKVKDDGSHYFKTDLLTVRVRRLGLDRWAVSVSNAGGYKRLSEGESLGGLEMAKMVGLVRARDVVKVFFEQFDSVIASR